MWYPSCNKEISVSMLLFHLHYKLCLDMHVVSFIVFSFVRAMKLYKKCFCKNNHGWLQGAAGTNTRYGYWKMSLQCGTARDYRMLSTDVYDGGLSCSLQYYY